MKQRELEMRLQKLRGFEDPKPHLEQYPTPAGIAADILYIAHAQGDIEGKSVIDLGCGNGIFAIGACLLGAADAAGMDIDEGAVRTAAANAADSGCGARFICGPVESVSGKFDTCIMNPPFGSQTKHADIPFLEKSMGIADVVYSMHNTGTMDFLRSKISKSGWDIAFERKYKFEIRHTFEFHRKEKQYFDVTMMRMVRR